MKDKNTGSRGWIAGVVTAAAASLCCVAPVLALIGGVSGAASSFSWIEPFRPYLIGFTVLVFGFAWYQKLKPQKPADCCSPTQRKASFVQGKTFLSIVTVIAGLLVAFPYYASVFYPRAIAKPLVMVQDNTAVRQAVFRIEGMTCESCTEHVNGELAKVKGVLDFQTSYDSARSIVRYDGSSVDTGRIASAINETGYIVTSIEAK
ncbi:MAG: mercuric transport protein MerTP [Bacteroidetes bacterium]|nr:mercuric transport protein MerTP [Bacteroidota bacterium]